MDGHENGNTAYDLLDSWKNQLQLSYVKLASSIARYEQTTQLTSEREQYRQLDRIARDIERAEYALKLFRLQQTNLAAASIVNERRGAAA
ncbi:MAG: hypothetical protein EXQ88_06910 [Alphaproteobacteria bacterium]|nr:hypothetical protein [Alphaproteobacteria bacterium]